MLWLCTIVVHSTAQNSSDNLHSYPSKLRCCLLEERGREHTEIQRKPALTPGTNRWLWSYVLSAITCVEHAPHAAGFIAFNGQWITHSLGVCWWHICDWGCGTAWHFVPRYRKQSWYILTQAYTVRLCVFCHVLWPLSGLSASASLLSQHYQDSSVFICLSTSSRRCLLITDSETEYATGWCLRPYCQTWRGGSSRPGSLRSRQPITWSLHWSGLETPSWSTKQ